MRTSKITAIGVGIFLTLSVNVGAGDFKHITIDGSFNDWAGIQPVLIDPSDTTSSIDYAAVYIANDADYLYLRITLHVPGDPFTSRENIFIDADNDVATGFSFGGIGSEMLIQSGVGYEERAGGFNDGFNFNGLDWAAAPIVATTNFEVRISRRAAYTSAPPGPVFTSDTIALCSGGRNLEFFVSRVRAGFGRTDLHLRADADGSDGQFDTGNTDRLFLAAQRLGHQPRNSLA